MNPMTMNPAEKRKALLLVGSPKGKASASFAIGSYLFRKLAAGGIATEEMTVAEALRSPDGRARFLEAMDSAPLIVVSFPLYVDQLPSPLIEALGHVAERRKGKLPTGQMIAAVVQCGFPESHQNRPALDIMRRFAAEAGYTWVGGLAMGMGGAMGRKPLEKAGGMARNAVKALDLAASALLAGKAIPKEAVALMGKPLMPKWLYLVAANYGMKSEAKKHGARKAMYAAPYHPL